MEYKWENRLEYAKQKAEDVIKNVEEFGMEFSAGERGFLADEIRSAITSVIIDAREAELKAQRKW